jgi:hypothetical protein
MLSIAHQCMPLSTRETGRERAVGLVLLLYGKSLSCVRDSGLQEFTKKIRYYIIIEAGTSLYVLRQKRDKRGAEKDTQASCTTY